MRDIAKSAIRLLLFTVVAAICLGVTNELTKGPIAERQQMILNESKLRVLPQAESFDEMELSNAQQYPSIRSVFDAKFGEDTLGYVFALSSQGYKGSIEMTLGINSAGAVTDLVINEQSETAGLGSKITEEPFLSQFWGIAAGPENVDSEVDTIGGATVSTSSVKNAVRDATQYAVNELGIIPTEDVSLAVKTEPTKEEAQMLSMFENGLTIQALAPFELLGYDTIRQVYLVNMRDGIGYVFDVLTPSSRSDIHMNVAISSDGKIVQVAVVEHNETEGYGSKITEPDFLGQFSGMLADEGSVNQADTISGATNSANAAMRGIAQAADYFDKFLKDGLPEKSDAVSSATTESDATSSATEAAGESETDGTSSATSESAAETQTSEKDTDSSVDAASSATEAQSPESTGETDADSSATVEGDQQQKGA